MNVITQEVPLKLGYGGGVWHSNLFIYVCNHGVGQQKDEFLDILPGNEGKIVLNKNRALLSWKDIATWLNHENLKDEYGNPIYGVCTIVLEACFAGEWIVTADIPSLHKDNHIIITTTDEDHVSYGYAGSSGYAMFSKPFFKAFTASSADTDGNSKVSYGEAWEYADAKVAGEMTKARSVRIDRSIFIKNMFKMLSRDVFDKNLLNMINDFFNLMKQDNLISVPLQGNLKPLYEELADWRKFRDYEMQSPQLSDNGVRSNSAGTKGNHGNNADTLPDNGNGDLSLQTYPGPN